MAPSAIILIKKRSRFYQEKKVPVFFHSMFYIFLIFNGLLLILLSLEWAREPIDSAWKNEEDVCRSTFSSFPRGVAFAMTVASLIMTYIFLLIYVAIVLHPRRVKFLVLRKEELLKPTTDSKRALMAWMISEMALLFYRFYSALTFFLSVFLMFEYLSCQGAHTPLDPSADQQASLLIMVLFVVIAMIYMIGAHSIQLIYLGKEEFDTLLTNRGKVQLRIRTIKLEELMRRNSQAVDV